MIRPVLFSICANLSDLRISTEKLVINNSCVCFFLIYLASGLYLWLLGSAVFGRWESGRSLFRAPWLGYAVLIACLQIAHFFTAINPTFSWIFLAASSLYAGGIVALRLRKVPFKAKELSAIPLLVWLALLIAVAWLAFRPVFNITTQKIVHYDVGLYYLQAIAWTTAFPIVPGLGNLLLNLGFNQSPFLVTSLFDSLGPHLWGYSPLGGLLPWLGLTLSGFALVQGLCAVLAMRKRLEPIEKAYAVSLPAWIYTLLINNISSNSPDIALACLQIHLFLCFASFLAAAKESQAFISEFAELILLGALGLCVKLNSIFFVAVIGLLSIAVALTRIGAPRLLGSRQLLYVTLAALVLCLPWAARGIVISGYPLFPSTVLSAPVDWRIPKADVFHFYNLIVSWGRQPYENLATVQSEFAWVPDWLRRNWDMKDQFERPLILGAVWTLLLAILAWRIIGLRKILIRLFIMVLPVAVSLVMWFFTAPDPRYLGSITWLFPLAVPLCLISERSLLSSALIGLSLCVNYLALGNLRYNTEWSWKRRAPGFPEIQKVEIEEGDNPFGIHLYYPKEGDQLFDAPLPGTKEMHPTLELFDEAKGISGGFRDVRIDDREREMTTDQHTSFP